MVNIVIYIMVCQEQAMIIFRSNNLHTGSKTLFTWSYLETRIASENVKSAYRECRAHGNFVP
ncbi:hypothetical protein C0J52_18848 [Blattella germanica]|nr:hypothetical protein C0J52_18848 [Blattella germanica]